MNENYNDDVSVKEEFYTSNCRERHSFWRTLLAALMTFLGAFCAFYVVADWHYKRMATFPYASGGKIERMMQKDMRAFDKMMYSENRDFARKAAHVIHMEQDKNAYKVIIDLRAFDNNENNVQVTTSGNVLTINGRSIKTSKNNEQIAEFQQNYMFGNNVNLANLTKETRGNFYIVTVPIGKQVRADDEDDD